MAYETLKRVQGDILRILGHPLCPYLMGNTVSMFEKYSEYPIDAEEALDRMEPG